MVERTAAGEAPSSPQPPEAGARRARLYGVLVRRRESEPTDNAVEPVRCRPANVAGGPASADFEHVVELPLTARRLLASLLRGLTLLLADEGKRGTKVLILDDLSL